MNEDLEYLALRIPLRRWGARRGRRGFKSTHRVRQRIALAARNRERGSSFLSEITFEPVNGSTLANLPLRALIEGAGPASLSEIGAAT